MEKYTDIQDQDHKLDLIDHVNHDHRKELLMIAQTYGKNDLIYEAAIADIYEEGAFLKVRDSQSDEEQLLFVRFELNGDLEEKILYLAYSSFAKKRVEFSHNARQFFEVINKTQVSKNMTRLTIKSQLPLPQYYAAYAYGFMLKILEKAPTAALNNSNKSSLLKNAFDRGFLWLMKHLPRHRRQKMLNSMNKDIRLYTLRQAFNPDGTSDNLHYGYVDIFTHGSSPGSVWVKQLEAGSLISSKTETDDKHEHLRHGQAVLIADEAAYPALAGILDFWSNPVPPIVILLCVDELDLNYFKGFLFPKNTILRTVTSVVEDHATHVLQLLENFKEIDKVWGAMENNTAKKIRHYVRNQRQLAGKNNHIKGYWRLQNKAA